jgi:hypothetical protein
VISQHLFDRQEESEHRQVLRSANFSAEEASLGERIAVDLPNSKVFLAITAFHCLAQKGKYSTRCVSSKAGRLVERNNGKVAGVLDDLAGLIAEDPISAVSDKN